MLEKAVKFIFFGNYFVGLLAIALSLETVIQLRIPFDPPLYYLLLFCGTVMYYTYAYTGALRSTSTANLRSEWYRSHSIFIRFSQWFYLVTCVVFSLVLLAQYWKGLLALPLIYWLMVIAIIVSSVLYYGLLPRSVIRLNLRNTGWLKAFVIGFVWAACVGLLPVVMLKVAQVEYHADPVLLIGLFIKNWMFCTVNAIMFDLKDYADDSNQQLQTFAVRYGLDRTITYILIPLTLIGIVCFFPFAIYRHLTFIPVLLNLIPFLLLIFVSYSMHRQKSIFYYLIVIDGIVMIKAICGILAMQFTAS